MNSRPQLRKNSRAMKGIGASYCTNSRFISGNCVLRLVPNSTGVIAMVASNLNTEKLPSLKRNSRPPLGNSFIIHICANPTHQEFSSYRGSLSTSFWMKQSNQFKIKKKVYNESTNSRAWAKWGLCVP